MALWLVSFEILFHCQTNSSLNKGLRQKVISYLFISVKTKTQNATNGNEC